MGVGDYNHGDGDSGNDGKDDDDEVSDTNFVIKNIYYQIGPKKIYYGSYTYLHLCPS